jgi:hypothetical protein
MQKERARLYLALVLSVFFKVTYYLISGFAIHIFEPEYNSRFYYLLVYIVTKPTLKQLNIIMILLNIQLHG